MPMRIKCAGCGATIFDSVERGFPLHYLGCPEDILRELGITHCPICRRLLKTSIETAGVAVLPYRGKDEIRNSTVQ